jgi:hypothetical protein
MFVKICAYCGKVQQLGRGFGKYCSREHAMIATQAHSLVHAGFVSSVVPPVGRGKKYKHQHRSGPYDAMWDLMLEMI